MNEQDWKILKVLYENKNITQTAKKLYISQPALTFRLQQIEAEFGLKIAHRDRGRRGVEFTTQGERLARYAKEMLLQLRQMKDLLWNAEASVKGTLRLGVSNMFAFCVLPGILKRFKSQYPDIDFNMTTGWSSPIVHSLVQQDVHVGIVRGDYNWPDQKKLLMEEPLLVVSKKKIELDELPSLPRIDYKTDALLKDTVDNWWLEKYQQAPFISMQVDKWEICKELVVNGLGYAILPGLSVRNNSNLFTIPLISKGNAPVIRKTWLLYRKESLKVSITKLFIDFLKTYDYGTPAVHQSLKRVKP
jgi:DNA-binding transcriptional LysR family regulator